MRRFVVFVFRPLSFAVAVLMGFADGEQPRRVVQGG
jgi:hypothetical protein